MNNKERSVVAISLFITFLVEVVLAALTPFMLLRVIDDFNLRVPLKLLWYSPLLIPMFMATVLLIKKRSKVETGMLYAQILVVSPWFLFFASGLGKS